MIDSMDCGHASGYACGVGGFSSRGLPLPMLCPTAYPELWEKSRPKGREQPSIRRPWGNPEVAEA